MPAVGLASGVLRANIHIYGGGGLTWKYTILGLTTKKGGERNIMIYILLV